MRQLTQNRAPIYEALAFGECGLCLLMFPDISTAEETRSWWSFWDRNA